jgi:hypothetical protein
LVFKASLKTSHGSATIDFNVGSGKLRACLGNQCVNYREIPIVPNFKHGKHGTPKVTAEYSWRLNSETENPQVLNGKFFPDDYSELFPLSHFIPIGHRLEGGTYIYAIVTNLQIAEDELNPSSYAGFIQFISSTQGSSQSTPIGKPSPIFLFASTASPFEYSVVDEKLGKISLTLSIK